MINDNMKEKIKMLEDMGLEVVVKKDGKIQYSTLPIEDGCCDKCEYFKLLPDPDPDDWFRDDDQKAVCTKLKAAIARGLERPSEWINIKKPPYCPYLERELTEEEKKIVDIRLQIAKEDYDR